MTNDNGREQGRSRSSRRRARKKGRDDRRREEGGRRNAEVYTPGRLDRSFRRQPDVRINRPKWVPAAVTAAPIPELLCVICNNPIKEVEAAFTDKASGGSVHFECALTRVTEREPLEKGDQVAYIGGGRFGIVHRENPRDIKGFKIKKIIEWENKDERAPWRGIVAEHYSNT
jgi:hypothetical protein